METLLECVKKEELPIQYQKYFEEMGGDAVYVPLNKSSVFGLWAGGLIFIFFSIIIFSTINHTYKYPTYNNFSWLAGYFFMILVGVVIFYKAYKKKKLVDNFSWPYGLYFDEEAMLIAKGAKFTLVPRHYVYLEQGRDISYDRYNGTVVHLLKYQGDNTLWGFSIDLGCLSDMATQGFAHWVTTGETSSLLFYNVR